MHRKHRRLSFYVCDRKRLKKKEKEKEKNKRVIHKKRVREKEIISQVKKMRKILSFKTISNKRRIFQNKFQVIIIRRRIKTFQTTLF